VEQKLKKEIADLTEQLTTRERELKSKLAEQVSREVHRDENCPDPFRS